MRSAALALALIACTPRDTARQANAARAVGHESYALIVNVCVEPAERAAALPMDDAAREIARLERMGCPAAVRAHDAFVTAHEAVVAVARAREAGECIGARGARCDLTGAIASLVRAGVALAQTADRLRAEAR